VTTGAARRGCGLRAGDVYFEGLADEARRDVGFVHAGSGAGEFVTVAVLGGIRAGAGATLLVRQGDVVDGAQSDLVDNRTQAATYALKPRTVTATEDRA
jgi:hypothetical protein